jgi:ATP-dependent Clp endopeptidase proteolytic subunit ClpP
MKDQKHKDHDVDDSEDMGPGPVTNRRFAFFMNEVSNETVRPMCEWIFASNFDSSDNRPKELTLVINSRGGDLHDAFALIDIMNGSQIPIRTIGLGLIASAGLLIFMSGKKGMRSLTPNTAILSHQWAWGAIGKQHELIAATKEWDLTQKRMIRHYRRCTGLSEDKVKKLLMAPADQWLSAEEALKFGLCDQVQDMGQYIPAKPKAKRKVKRAT